MWYPLSLGTLSFAAFNIVGCTVKVCVGQLFGCDAQAHTTRHGMVEEKKATHTRVEREAYP